MFSLSRGTIAVHDLTIGNGCVLHLSNVGQSRGTHYFGDVGNYAFDSLTVNGGGEVKMIDGTAHTTTLRMTVGFLRIEGGGTIHHAKIHIEAETFIIDDLGTLVGDTHEESCTTGNGINNGNGGSGAGHAGRGGQGYGTTSTGAPYGNVFEPIDFGCRGGYGNNGNTYGRGGGVIYLHVSNLLQVDGHVSVNGGAGTSRAGGGSGGSIWIDTHTIRVSSPISHSSFK